MKNEKKEYWSPSMILSWIAFGMGTLCASLIMIFGDWEDKHNQVLSLVSYMVGVVIFNVVAGVKSLDLLNSDSGGSRKPLIENWWDVLGFLIVILVFIIWIGFFIWFFDFAIKPLFFLIPSGFHWFFIVVFSWSVSYFAFIVAIYSDEEEKTGKNERMDKYADKYADKRNELVPYRYKEHLENCRKTKGKKEKESKEHNAIGDDMIEVKMFLYYRKNQILYPYTVFAVNCRGCGEGFHLKGAIEELKIVLGGQISKGGGIGSLHRDFRKDRIKGNPNDDFFIALLDSLESGKKEKRFSEYSLITEKFKIKELYDAWKEHGSDDWHYGDSFDRIMYREYGDSFAEKIITNGKVKYRRV